MAENSSEYLTYVLAIEKKHEDFLGQIRHWSNLKIATNEGTLWIKNLTQKQIGSLEIKSIPFAHIYLLNKNLLFPLGSNLPSLKLPSLLWTIINRGLPISLPKENHNYFGVHETLTIKLTNTSTEHEPFALITTICALEKYIETAPAIRLTKINWVILDNHNTLLLGTPLLPLIGHTYWNNFNFLIPTGYDYDLPIINEIINEKCNQKQDWILWNQDATYVKIPKNKVKQLSLSSFRLSLSRFNTELQ